MSDRRRFFKEIFSSITKAAAEFTFEVVKGKEDLIRPPGSADEDTFTILCQKCGECIKSCPTNIIIKYQKLNPVFLDTPVIDFERGYCELCYNCIKACKHGALKEENLKKYRYVAKLLKDKCVAFKDMFCLSCYWSCPNIDKAITLINNSQPEFHPSECKGCGRCINVCPTTPKSITFVKIKVKDDRN